MQRSPVRSAVKVSAAAVDRLWPPRRGVVVLLYHRVGGRSNLPIDLPAGLFAQQMAALAETGRATTLDDALSRLHQPVPLSPDPVVVTFDDGTADLADVAMPVLAHHKIPATVYLATAFVDEQRDFPHGGRPLSWPALRDVVASGLVTVGSHTHTHALLDRIPGPEIPPELDRSIELIGERLGVAADHFAYPKALAGTPDADAAVRRRFRSAALAGTRANPYGRTDPYRLQRSPIQVSDGLRWFRHKAGGGMAFEDTLRRFVNRWRLSDAVT
jgi:peptidoglycan/xylan/chitin deacetylase (PgdA/CDA1 family)